jgi:uncharacterized protein YjbI with pentapeptide repeats
MFSNKLKLNVHQSQKAIYKFLREEVRENPPELVLFKFKELFILLERINNRDVTQALYNIIVNNDEKIFRNTFKRSCYILVNNWASNRKYKYILELLHLLDEAKAIPLASSQILNCLREWLANFVNSEDYQELKLITSTYAGQKTENWSHRYTSYLLVSQYLNTKNPLEQREIARNLSKRLKQKFNFQLAMYTAHCDRYTSKDEQSYNPTKLGNKVVCLIKEVVPWNISFTYENYAHLFVHQTQGLNYKKFKQTLHGYLIFGINNKNFLDIFKKQIAPKIENLYLEHQQETLNIELLLRSCRQIISFLITEDGHTPSPSFILLNTQGSTLYLAIALLKIILICKYVKSHLDISIAQLIRYYENVPEKECNWFINFLEIFNVLFAVYTENVQYNLVKLSHKQPCVDLNDYRIFPQLKGANLRGIDLSAADIRGIDLSAADLQEANLIGVDLSYADLSLAKLSRANLSSAILNGIRLVTANLSYATLSGASLNSADMRHCNLQEANLSSARLVASKLNRVNLQQANLTGAKLSSALLNGSNLSGANFQDVDLQHSELCNANLTDANLSNVNFRGAILRFCQLQNANLSNANLHHTILSNSNLIGANLTKANLNYTDLEHANLRSADLSSTILRCATLSDANLSHANLSRADLSHSDFSHSNLDGADLSYVFLRHVDLRDANLSHANLRGANLFGTNLSQANVKEALFGKNSGLSEETKLALEQQGAVFDELL